MTGERRFRFWPRALSLQSMRGRMALLLGVAMLPAGAIAMQVGLNSVSVRQAAYEEALGRRALQSIEYERVVIDQMRSLVRVLATSPSTQAARGGNCARWFSDVKEDYHDIAAIAVQDNDGRILCSVPAAPEHYAPQPSELRRLARERDDLAMAFVPHGSLTNSSVLGALAPLHDDKGRRVGFVGMSMKADRMRDVLNQSAAQAGARAAIVGPTGEVLIESTAHQATQPSLPQAKEISRHFGPQPSFISLPNGAAVVAPLSRPDLYVVMSWPPDQPSWRKRGNVALSIAAPLLIWILAVAAGWFAIEIYVARPLSSLETAARAYARGEDASEDAFTNAPQEIRSLRRTLAAMAKTLRGRETRLVEALAEERALLREVHHRVKNNLQMVASLLSIQTRASTDEAEARGLSRAHDRVQLLALVHQKLYASGELREVRLDELVAEMARQLAQARGVRSQKIVLQLDLGASRADADRALPLAFMVGESVSLALDVAGEEQGAELSVALREDENGSIRLAINTPTNITADSGPGTRLVDAFARQLGAQVGRVPGRPFPLWISVPPAARAAE